MRASYDKLIKKTGNTTLAYLRLRQYVATAAIDVFDCLGLLDAVLVMVGETPI